MKKIELHGRNAVGVSTHALVDNEMFDYLNQFHWFYSKHGTKKNGEVIHYVTRKKWVGSKGVKKYETIFMHREVMNAKKGQLVDHGNHSTYDNQKCNLTLTDYTGNNRNRSVTNNPERYKGIYKDKRTGRYTASVSVKKESIHLGVYDTDTEAGIAYNHGAKLYFGNAAFYNDIENWENIHPSPVTRFNNERRDNTSGVRGVHFSKQDKVWIAKMDIKKERIILGRFKTKLDAITARRDGELKHFGRSDINLAN